MDEETELRSKCHTGASGEVAALLGASAPGESSVPSG